MPNTQISFTVPDYVAQALDQAPGPINDRITAQVVELIETELGVVKPVTLRSLGFSDCAHPLLAGRTPNQLTQCPFCGGKLLRWKGDQAVCMGGSIDFPMEPVFVSALQARLAQMEKDT